MTSRMHCKVPCISKLQCSVQNLPVPQLPVPQMPQLPVINKTKQFRTFDISNWQHLELNLKPHGFSKICNYQGYLPFHHSLFVLNDSECHIYTNSSRDIYHDKSSKLNYIATPQLR